MYKIAAEQGNADAQLILGSLYMQDQGGLEQDFEEAVKWYTLAANQGLAIAQYCLGLCYNEGIGVEQDRQKAKEWFTKAAKQGFTEKEAQEMFN